MSRFSNGVGKIQCFPDVERLQMVLNQNKESMLKRSDMSKRELPSKYLAMSPAVGLCQQQPRFLVEDERTPCATQGISARHCMRSAVNWPLLLSWYSSWCTLPSSCTYLVLSYYSPFDSPLMALLLGKISLFGSTTIVLISSLFLGAN